MMTNNLSHLKALALAATPGEWGHMPTRFCDCDHIIITEKNEVVAYTSRESENFRRDSMPNAAFIAAANPKTVIELIEAMEMMGAELKTLAEYHGPGTCPNFAAMNEALARYEALTSHPPPAS